MRKAHSAHVRCSCGGDKTHAKGACAQDGDPHGELSTGLEASQQQFLINDTADNCCCSHGSRCTCTVKKEHLDPVPESDSDEASSSSTPALEVKRPRAHTTQSEGGLTVFSNGHHKPVHKHNNMAHKCGLPYVVPRAHSIHGPSPSGLANRSVDNLPHTSTIEALHSESHIKDSIVSAQQEQRKVKSEHGSPLFNPSNLDQLNGLLPPLDLSSIPSDYSFLQNMDSFSAIHDHEQPLFSAGLGSASIDWSHYDGLDFNNENFAASSYSQAPSFTGFDFSSVDQPALTTTSTSGEISEVEDFGPLNDNAAAQPVSLNNQYGSDFETSDFGGEIDSYRLSAASSYIGLAQAQLLGSNNIESLDMESFLKGVATSSGYPKSDIPVYLEDGEKTDESPIPFEGDVDFQPPLPEDENEAFWISQFQQNIASTSRNELVEDTFWVQ
jgi:hypothetical protein